VNSESIRRFTPICADRGGKTLRQSVQICGSHAVNEGEWHSHLQIRDALRGLQSEAQSAPAFAYLRIARGRRWQTAKPSADSRSLRRLHGAESICANLCKSADRLSFTMVNCELSLAQTAHGPGRK
jgi:hypothetical protein